MQTTIKRLYDDPSCRQLKIEVPIRRAEAIKAILMGFRAASDLELHRDVARNIVHSLYVQWAGYQQYRAAAPLGKQHLTHVQLCPGIGGHRYEYVFPGGLSPDECDVLCREMIGEDGDDLCRKREWLVTSTLAGMLHGDGVSLADYVIGFACGQTVRHGPGLSMTPASPPTRLSAAARDRGWSATVGWLRDTQVMLEHCLEMVRKDSAVWVPADAPRLPWEPLILRYHAGKGCLRLAMGAEAAAYAGHRVELAVSAAERADWLSDQDAAFMAGMSLGQWRRWIQTHREVRVGRPIARDGHMAKNRRLTHTDDLRRALRLSHTQDDGDSCRPMKCPQRCFMARNCPHRDHGCPAS